MKRFVNKLCILFCLIHAKQRGMRTIDWSTWPLEHHKYSYIWIVFADAHVTLWLIICNFIKKRYIYSIKWTWLSANFEVAFSLIHLYYNVMIFFKDFFMRQNHDVKHLEVHYRRLYIDLNTLELDVSLSLLKYLCSLFIEKNFNSPLFSNPYRLSTTCTM